MAYEIRRMQWTDWDDLQRFLQEQYRPTYPLTDRQLFAWQFGYDNAEDPTVWVVRQTDRMVGMLGYMPTPVFLNGSVVNACWYANWMIDPVHRGGIGMVLLRRFHSLFDVTLGQGAGKMNQALSPLLGYRIDPEIPRYIAYFEPTIARELVYPESRLDVHPVASTTWEAHNRQAVGAQRIRSSSDLDHLVFDWTRYSMLRNGTVRSAHYLQWRYLDHPRFEYAVFAAGQVTAPALAVIRIEQVKDRPERIGRLVELFFPDGESGRTGAEVVLGASLVHARAAGASAVDFVCSHPDVAAVLSSAGFRSDRDTAKLALCFQPLYFGIPHQNFMVWVHPRLGPCPPLNRWYLTKSDGDQDRPN